MPRQTTSTDGRFEGFADSQARFFRALAKNQNRDWFLAHRDEYELGWRRPMQALLDEVRDGLARAYPGRELGEAKVFRIFRDVRFSNDKSPYKTQIAGYVPLARSAKAPGGPVAVYLHIGLEHYVGAGHYMMDGAQLERYRAALLDERRGAELGRIAARLERSGFAIHGRETLRKVPRGVAPDHPRAELAKQKGLVAGFPELEKRLIVSHDLVGWIVQQARKTAPLVEWLAANVAPEEAQRA
jgi:uncharacterized protein (TIGR02453 family)